MNVYKRVAGGAVLFLVLGFAGALVANAAAPSVLGTAATFAILSDTFTRNSAVTSVSGDLGYTTLSGSGSDTISNGTTFTPSPVQAGADQATALSNLNGLTCTPAFTFGSDQDLSLLTQPLTPGVYCINGVVSIGTGGITLNGLGMYVFRSTDALNTVDNSAITLTGGAYAGDVYWTPGAATTLGANTTFVGTVIDDSGITVGANSSWLGRALAFNGTVTTDTDTITVPHVTVISATSGDTDANGQIDRITVVYSGEISDANYDALAVTGYTMPGTGTGSGTNTFVYDLTESGVPDTGATPALNFTAANAMDLAGSALDITGAPANAADGAKPVAISATFYDATGNDGRLDLITVVWSENLQSTGVAADWDISSASDFSNVTEGVVGCNNGAAGINECKYHFTTTTVKTDVGDLTLSYTAGASVTDGINNADSITFTSASTPAFTDAANPIALSATTGDANANGKIDQLTVVYSEAVNDPDYNALAPTCYSLQGTGSGSGTDTLVYFMNENVDNCSSLAIQIVNTGSVAGGGTSALFTYSGLIYDQTDTNPTPLITGAPGGTFSSFPAGLSLNPSTGTINLVTSALGTYQVFYTENTGLGLDDTGATPVVTFSSANAADLLGNNLNSAGAPANASDGAAPTGTVTLGTPTLSDSDLVQEVTVTYDEAMDGGSTPTITFGNNLGALASNGDGSWTSSTTWQETFTLTDVDEQTVGATADSSGASDLASNTEGPDVEGVFNIDTLAPTVTDGNISITSTGSGTSGRYIIGDTITAAWDNTAGGDNNTDIAGVTIDFSAFTPAGGPATIAATNSGDVWTASYLIPAGTVDFAINRNVSVTATDTGGNATTAADTTNSTLDDQAPSDQDTVFSPSISAQGGAAVTVVTTAVGNSRWFAPSGTIVFVASATMTKAACDGCTTIAAPATEGAYKLFVLDSSGNISAESTATLTVDNTPPSAPGASPIAGSYVGNQNVTLTSTGSTSIRFTTDGSDPTTCAGGTLFVGAISVSSSQTISARGCDDAGNISALSTFAYTITVPSSGGGGGGGSGLGFYVAPIGTNPFTITPDPTSTGPSYNPALAFTSTLTIDQDKGLVAPPGTAHCTGNTLIKLQSDNNPLTQEDTTVYYCGSDGKRYDFPNPAVFFSWYNDFSSVTVISPEVMASIPLGGNVTYRPGKRMIKLQTDANVYAVSRDGLLRWVTSQAIAKALYGDEWNQQIDDVSDVFFLNYTVGDPITLSAS